MNTSAPTSQMTDGYPDDYELKKLIDRAGHCTDLLEQAVNLVETDEEDIALWEFNCYSRISH